MASLLALCAGYLARPLLLDLAGRVLERDESVPVISGVARWYLASAGRPYQVALGLAVAAAAAFVVVRAVTERRRTERGRAGPS